MKNFLRRLGSPDAISWISALVIVVLQLIASLISSQVDFQGRFPLFLTVRLTSLLLLVGVLGLGKLVLLRVAAVKPRPLVTLTIFMLSTVVGTVTFDLLLVATGFTSESRIVQRLIQTSITTPAGLTVVAMLVTYSREFSARMRDLRATVENLTLTREHAAERIELRRTELTATVRVQIVSQLEQLSGQKRDVAVEGMLQLVEDVLRPLSYRLAGQIEPEAMPSESSRVRRIQWKVIFRRLLQRNPFHPVASSIWLGLSVVSFLAINFGLAGLVTSILLVICTWGLSYVGALVWNAYFQGMPALLKIVIFSAETALIAVVSAFVVETTSDFSVIAEPRLLLWVCFSIFLSWIIALLFSTYSSLKEAEDDLAATIEELKREVIQLNLSYRQLQNNISRVLHGPIQQAITAAIIKSQSSSSPEDALDISQLTARIKTALAGISSDAGPTTPITVVISELTELWEGASDIHFDCDPAIAQAIDSDPQLSTAVQELINESCANAVRHGQAQTIRVTLSLTPEEHVLTLSVENDGRPLGDPASSGLGSQLFDEFCLDWTRTQNGTRVLVVARLPFNRGATALELNKL